LQFPNVNPVTEFVGLLCFPIIPSLLATFFYAKVVTKNHGNVSALGFWTLFITGIIFILVYLPDPLMESFFPEQFYFGRRIIAIVFTCIGVIGLVYPFIRKRFSSKGQKDVDGQLNFPDHGNADTIMHNTKDISASTNGQPLALVSPYPSKKDTNIDEAVQIVKEDFARLSYRQKFVVREFGYLLSPEDAEVVGKMMGNFQDKEALAFCQANGKKVVSSQP
jgi:hypothetical protein